MIGKFIVALSLLGGTLALDGKAEGVTSFSCADSLQTGKSTSDTVLRPKVYKEPKVKVNPVKLDLSSAENVGQTKGDVELPVVRFPFNSVRIATAERAKVSRIAQMLKEHPDATLRIEGYTDSRGSDEVNAQVSKARAEAVKERLVSRYGIDASRISTVGMGSEKEATAEKARRAVSVLIR